VNSREWSEEAKEIRDPQNDTKNNHSVQDRLNTRLHRDEAVDNPKQNPDYDERDNKLHERHLMFLFSILGLIEIGRRFLSAKTGRSAPTLGCPACCNTAAMFAADNKSAL
jgi:hypothetical protein